MGRVRRKKEEVGRRGREFQQEDMKLTKNMKGSLDSYHFTP
jgi:hypothetical protein